MLEAARYIERVSAGVFPPKVIWEGGPIFSETPRKGLVTKLNSLWMEIKKPIPIWGVVGSTFAHEYREGGMAVSSTRTEHGIIVYDASKHEGHGLNLPWALRDWRRQLLLGSDIADAPDDELTKFGVEQATFLRQHVTLLVLDPEEMLIRHS